VAGKPTAALRVLFVASECAPLTKTGGLGDVAAALPAGLRALGLDARVLLPAYREVRAALPDARALGRVPASAGLPAAELLSAQHPNGVPLLLLACPELFDRGGGPYLDPSGRDWPDNARRFGLLSRVAALLATTDSPCPWQCDILHCNDWQSALAPAYLHWRGRPAGASLVTIHNLAYQGIFPREDLAMLGLPPQSFAVEGVEFHGQLSFLKAGLFHAQRISTVSPTYAREIQSEPLGFGLHGLLATRSGELEGILNGIDPDAWNPATDPCLEATYDAATLARKALNTRALRSRFGLDDSPGQPLLGVVSRLVPQKGIDLVVEAAARLLALPAQLIVLGTGDAGIERSLATLAAREPGKVAVIRGFDEALSHRIEAGADVFLMPSRFEPCGLNQMYSQRYGTPPVVRRTGGLADSVVDCTPDSLAAGTATGFVFQQPTAGALGAAVERAVNVWRKPDAWRRLQQNAMARDFAWTASARRYRDLYLSMLRAPAAGVRARS
jgi:starch synthase